MYLEYSICNKIKYINKYTVTDPQNDFYVIEQLVSSLSQLYSSDLVLFNEYDVLQNVV